ncbi:hypothetical protein PL373_07935 [Tenacibaculum maritimum]|nr:hypothetical protein [Tenacibaculum maritimum]MDB0601075.1 hypothetical protein [Tenacibaculum maritimum]MDB0612156.1 hypothetical protein [Tenacibaculum maritimum]
MTFDSNDPEFAWANVQVVRNNGLLTRIRGIKFSMKKEKEYLHARGDQAHAIQHGNKSGEGEIKLLQSELDKMQAGLDFDEDITDIVNDTLIVSFVRKSAPTKIVTFILKGVEYTEDTRESNQGDKFSEISVPIMFLRRESA